MKKLILTGLCVVASWVQAQQESGFTSWAKHKFSQVKTEICTNTGSWKKHAVESILSGAAAGSCVYLSITGGSKLLAQLYEAYQNTHKQSLFDDVEADKAYTTQEYLCHGALCLGLALGARALMFYSIDNATLASKLYRA